MVNKYGHQNRLTAIDFFYEELQEVAQNE